jgi:formylglycine-generating enzyme required for sulfatase activity
MHMTERRFLMSPEMAAGLMALALAGGCIVLSAQASAQTVTKTCGACGLVVSPDARVGMKCPWCGVIWGEESVSHTGTAWPAPSPPSAPPPREIWPAPPPGWVDRAAEMRKDQVDALAELAAKGTTAPPGMVLIPAGKFTMGSESGASDERPVHTVSLPAFWIDRTEVTNGQYWRFLQWIRRTGDHSRCVQGEPTHKNHTPDGWTSSNGALRPVVGVDWYDACAYAAWARRRLPTEAEWEKAARGTDGRCGPWGNAWDGRKCNSLDGGKHTVADVGSYPQGASPYGCLDMAGNVWEWTSSTNRPYPYDPMDGRDSASGSGFLVLRGGSWRTIGHCSRSTERSSYRWRFRDPGCGFRCARSI